MATVIVVCARFLLVFLCFVLLAVERSHHAFVMTNKNDRQHDECDEIIILAKTRDCTPLVYAGSRVQRLNEPQRHKESIALPA
jgi:hypothetical protein